MAMVPLLNSQGFLFQELFKVPFLLMTMITMDSRIFALEDRCRHIQKPGFIGIMEDFTFTHHPKLFYREFILEMYHGLITTMMGNLIFSLLEIAHRQHYIVTWEIIPFYQYLYQIFQSMWELLMHGATLK